MKWCAQSALCLAIILAASLTPRGASHDYPRGQCHAHWSLGRTPAPPLLVAQLHDYRRGGRWSVLRLRGGKRGRNSVVVGKHIRQKNAWTHFTGGESFGSADPGSGTFDSSWRASQHRAAPEGRGLEPEGWAGLQRMRTGETAKMSKGKGKGHAAARIRRGRGKAMHHLLSAIAGALQGRGAAKVLELGCNDWPCFGQLLPRINAECPNVTHYVGVDQDVESLNATISHLAQAYPLQASVFPRGNPLQIHLLHGEPSQTLRLMQGVSSSLPVESGAGASRAMQGGFDVVVAAMFDRLDIEARDGLAHVLFQSDVPHILLFLSASCQITGSSARETMQSDADEMLPANLGGGARDNRSAMGKAYAYMVDIASKHGYVPCGIAWQRIPRERSLHHQAHASQRGEDQVETPAAETGLSSDAVECLCIFSLRVSGDRQGVATRCDCADKDDASMEDAMHVDAGSSHSAKTGAHAVQSLPREGWPSVGAPEYDRRQWSGRHAHATSERASSVQRSFDDTSGMFTPC